MQYNSLKYQKWPKRILNHWQKTTGSFFLEGKSFLFFFLFLLGSRTLLQEEGLEDNNDWKREKNVTKRVSMAILEEIWKNNKSILVHVKQWSPSFLAPGIGFTEDNFSTDWGCKNGLWMILVHYIYYTHYFYY